MDEVTTFNNNTFGNIRVARGDNDTAWFVAKDVCQILEYTNPSKAIADHVEDEDKLNNDSLASLGQRGGWLINESGLYSLVLSSKMPGAKAFKRWITSDVLPTIRKHGMYATPQTVEQMLADPDTMIQTLIALKEERAKRQALEAQAEVNQPKVLFADTISKSKDNILIGDMAKLLCDKAFKIGQKRLFKLLRDRKVLQENNVPYQRFIDAGYFEIKENSFEIREQVVLNYTTLVTPRGQMWITNSIKDWVNDNEG